MFPQLATVIDDAGDNLDVKCVQDTAAEYLSNLMERIQHYFPEQKDPQKANKWIRNPFAATVNVEELNISVDLKKTYWIYLLMKVCETLLNQTPLQASGSK